MAAYHLTPMADGDFAAAHAVYAQEDLFLSYDWAERLRGADPRGGGLLLLRDGTAVGGVRACGGHISAPFLILPEQDRRTFWAQVLSALCPPGENLALDFIPDSHAEALAALGAARTRSQLRMLRPTAPLPGIAPAALDGDYVFAELTCADRDEILQLVHRAHASGYTVAAAGPRNPADEARAIDKRLADFTQTRSLHLSALIRQRGSGILAAVCMAGIYPDSPNRFSTIHQVSVAPEHRRRGLARAMMLRTIARAADLSPVVTLGVMAGNPARGLYERLGFAAGPVYSDYRYPG